MGGASLTPAGGLALVSSARRFENWEFAYALVLGLGEAARYALAAGVERTGARASEHAAYLRQRLAALPGVTVEDRGERLCAIVTASIAGLGAGGAGGLREIVLALRRDGINLHNITVPVAGRPPLPVLRISPHYYNTREELDSALSALSVRLAGAPHA